ncbi:SCF ubiquitin ligase complex subunit cdc4 [Yamadazyma tenuis]|uniref:WD40 repeat-like protein n=1 Tax=Candida tenuis (strain ATCC 10573 / BCRC 21748 / CBS 615 / JCM 9827 / NBRC 10315 / NRRL Y-1498 / VKM Y-70) TaxID=590646 RepID=G3BCG0_CANTC|nr:WD40 repeat-like protein [Yamadazyma tenuis ATCC 10573]EGV60826.1 WD40 repeat-like protein [Yamadazyma tenuis ATCC 10573]WEJ93903.1 SCF ubiquitin ligase complex subunit cdc4 [Yamadazyma tenuis]
MSNTPPMFPLQNVPAKHEYSVSNPAARLSDFWLQNEYSKLSLAQHNRENRKRIRDGDTILEEDINESDDMISSDTDMSISQLSQTSFHPPKRRLTVLSPMTTLTPTFPDSHHHENNMMSSTDGLNDVVSVQPRTPDAGHTATNTPVSDMEEQPQQLPLPSPSASPVHSGMKQDLPDPIEDLLANVPTSQGDLINLIQNLSLFLTERNQNHLVFKLLQNVNRLTLSSLGNTIFHNLKRDLLTNFPSEITRKILDQLDHKSLFNLALVNRKWNRVVNGSNVWVELLKKDRLMESPEDIEREIANPDQLISEWADPAANSELNIAQLLYKKRLTIYNRWMNPKYEPKRISIKVPSQGNNVVTCLQHDDEKIITGVDDRLINVHDTKTGALLKVLKGHEGGVWALKYTGNTLVSGATDRTVRIWNIRTGKCTHIFKGHTSTVRCLDILHPVKIGRDESGNDIIFPSVPLLVTGSRDHNLNVWRLPIIPDTDEDDGIPCMTYDSSDINNPFLMKVLVGHTQSVRSVSAYGNLIVSGSYDATVRVWDLMRGGTCVQVLAGHVDRIYSTVLDYKNKICYSGSMDSTINIWNVDTGELLHTLKGHGSLVGLLELSKDYLVSAAADTTLRVWNPKTGENYSKLEGHSAAITCFQHDALRIISGSERMLKLWDIRKGKFVKDILADVTGGIWQVRFDFNRCVAAVQRSINDREETFIEILDYSEPPNNV